MLRIVPGRFKIYISSGERGSINGWKPVVEINLQSWALPIMIDYNRHEDGKYFKWYIVILFIHFHLNHYSGY